MKAGAQRGNDALALVAESRWEGAGRGSAVCSSAKARTLARLRTKAVQMSSRAATIVLSLHQRVSALHLENVISTGVATDGMRSPLKRRVDEVRKSFLRELVCFCRCIRTLALPALWVFHQQSQAECGHIGNVGAIVGSTVHTCSCCSLRWLLKEFHTCLREGGLGVLNDPDNIGIPIRCQAVDLDAPLARDTWRDQNTSCGIGATVGEGEPTSGSRWTMNVHVDAT